MAERITPLTAHLMATTKKPISTALMAAAVLGFAMGAGLAADQPGARETAENPSPLRVPLQGTTGDELFRKLLEHNRLRESRLLRYSAARSYDVARDKGKLYAEEVVRMDPTAGSTGSRVWVDMLSSSLRSLPGPAEVCCDFGHATLGTCTQQGSSAKGLPVRA